MTIAGRRDRPTPRHITSDDDASQHTYRLTGPDLLSYDDVAAVLSTVIGRPITSSERSFADDKEAMIRAGVPAPVAEMNAQFFSLIAAGDADWLSEDVPSLLGRSARSFAQSTQHFVRPLVAPRCRNAHRSPLWAYRPALAPP